LFLADVTGIVVITSREMRSAFSGRLVAIHHESIGKKCLKGLVKPDDNWLVSPAIKRPKRVLF